MIERKWGRSILKVLLPSIRIFQSIAIVWISEAREQEREFCEQPLLKLWSLELLLLQTLNGNYFQFLDGSLAPLAEIILWFHVQLRVSC